MTWAVGSCPGDGSVARAGPSGLRRVRSAGTLGPSGHDFSTAFLPPRVTTDQALADAADENLAIKATLPCSALRGARVERTPELTVVDSGLPCDTFNLVCRARLPRDTAVERIERALAFFRVTGNPFSWWLGPGASPPELPALLKDAGLEPSESELAMALDLDKLGAPPVSPRDLRVTRVRTPEELADFARLSAANWDPPDPLVTRFYHEAASAFLDTQARQWLYLGLLDGTAVATAEVTIGGGVAGVYAVSTQPARRGQGIGSMMTWAPLQDARAAGLSVAILQAAEMGQRLYARLGFRPFGTITEYK